MPQRDLNLTEFTPIPGMPGYLVAPDGRVASLKKRQPRLLAWELPESDRDYGVTVKLNGERIRVRDIVLVLFGTAVAFQERRAAALEVAA